MCVGPQPRVRSGRGSGAATDGCTRPGSAGFPAGMAGSRGRRAPGYHQAVGGALTDCQSTWAGPLALLLLLEVDLGRGIPVQGGPDPGGLQRGSGAQPVELLALHGPQLVQGQAPGQGAALQPLDLLFPTLAFGVGAGLFHVAGDGLAADLLLTLAQLGLFLEDAADVLARLLVFGAHLGGGGSLQQ